VGEAGVLAEDVALDADGSFHAQPGNVHAGQAGTVIERAGSGVDVVVRMVVPVIMVVVMRMVVVVMMTMVMVVGVLVRLTVRRVLAASAYRAHYAISMSPTRNA
jgi:hypothetical protein